MLVCELCKKGIDDPSQLASVSRPIKHRECGRLLTEKVEETVGALAVNAQGPFTLYIRSTDGMFAPKGMRPVFASVCDMAQELTDFIANRAFEEKVSESVARNVAASLFEKRILRVYRRRTGKPVEANLNEILTPGELSAIKSIEYRTVLHWLQNHMKEISLPGCYTRPYIITFMGKIIPMQGSYINSENDDFPLYLKDIVTERVMGSFPLVSYTKMIALVDPVLRYLRRQRKLIFEKVC